MKASASVSLPSWLAPEHLHGMLRGVEKEGLRMQTNGYLAQTPHPKGLGSTLTHPHITTDYSESLLELITAPKASISDMLTELTELHALVYSNLENDEILWPLSMPCMLSTDDKDIPLAQYGSSNIGRLKTLYRNGLGMRYGRRMQTIAGLHYNLSFPDALFEKIQQQYSPEKTLIEVKNERYLGLTRNFKRLSILVLYLLGASPCVCACFLVDRQHHLQKGSHSLFLPNATALRMGRLGYQNSAQDDLGITYNDLTTYVTGLRAAISKPHASFTELGVDDAHGNPTQINDHILQIENEFYSNIRPKQVAKSGETPTHALEERGIAYVELRAVDIDPFSSIGISEHGAHFLETLALYCLLSDSPELHAAEEKTLSENQANVVNAGRDATTQIRVNDELVNFHSWIKHTLMDMQDVAILLDKANNTHAHTQALTEMLARTDNPSLTPSAQLLEKTMAHDSLWKVGKQLAESYASNYLDTNYLNSILPSDKKIMYARMAEDSLVQQKQREKSDTVSFTEFVQAYR